MSGYIVASKAFLSTQWAISGIICLVLVCVLSSNRGQCPLSQRKRFEKKKKKKNPRLFSFESYLSYKIAIITRL